MRSSWVHHAADFVRRGRVRATLHRAARTLSSLFVALGTQAAHAQDPTATAIEYYNASLDHYFITAFADEAAMLDAGAPVKGWTRTGARFGVWADPGDDPGAVAVCRFFGTPERGPDSHFYTADASECTSVKQNPDWTFEGIAFYIGLPQAGNCAAVTTPVYRSFHPGASVSESNHRFTVDLTLHEKMAPSSILEGRVMCAPLSAADIEADAARLLEQTTFGTSTAALEHVQSIGASAWLDEQFAAPASRYGSYRYVPAGMAASYCATDPDPIPTYDQDTIEGYAHVFTGWTYPVPPGAQPRAHNPKNFVGDMIGVEANHDTGSKMPLDDVVAPAGLPMSADLANAIDTVFRHPNVGPFIGRQLIQKLVTGDPTPQYVARVAAAFDDNGAGVRGDMKAVLRALLLDPEARGALKVDAGYGKLREPVLFLTGAARALDTSSDGVFLAQQSAALGQNVFNPASVFNYYPPTYVVPDTSANGPEFALQNSSTAINRYNALNAFAFGSIAPLGTLPGAIGTTPDFGALAALSGDTDALLDRIDTLFLHHTMPAEVRAAIAAAVHAIPATDTTQRARTAVYLTVTSADYQVER